MDFLSFLNPALASDYRGFAAVMVLLAVLTQVVSVYRGFFITESGISRKMTAEELAVYFVATNRIPNREYNPALPLHALAVIYGSNIYVGMMLFGGDYSLLWGVLFAIGTQMATGAVGAVIFGQWAGRKVAKFGKSL